MPSRTPPDREQLILSLREVRAGEEDEVMGQVEGMIMSLGAPFVPGKHDGVIYVRPPLS